MTKISNQYSLTNVLTADPVNGRVGIGTATPGAPLSVVGNSSGYTLYSIGRNNADNASVISFRSNSAATEYAWIESGVNSQLDFGTNGNYRMRIASDGTMILGGTSTSGTAGSGSGRGNLVLAGSISNKITFNNNSTTVNGGIYSDSSEFSLYGSAFMGFNTGGSERMRILSNGNVLIGSSTDTGDKLRVNGSIASGGTNAGFFFQSRVSGNFLGFYTDNNSTFLVYNTNVGNIATINQSNGNYTALSDINKKKDFEQSTIGLNEVLQLKPTLYRFKTEDDSSPKDLGFIAQEVKEFIPQAYSESGEGEKKFIGLNQMPIIAALTKAIQEQQLQINELKALLNA